MDDPSDTEMTLYDRSHTRSKRKKIVRFFAANLLEKIYKGYIVKNSLRFPSIKSNKNKNFTGLTNFPENLDNITMTHHEH